MARVLIWLALGAAVWWVWRRHVQGTQDGASRPPQGQGRSDTPAPMLRCAHCGLHLPGSDALLAPDGQSYCGAEHRALHQRDHAR